MPLDPEQQDTLARIIDPVARPLFLAFAKSMNSMRLLKLNIESEAKAIVDQMDPGETLPTKTGLVGAKPLTKEQIQGLLAALDHVLLLDKDDSRKLAIAVGGLQSLVG